MIKIKKSDRNTNRHTADGIQLLEKSISNVGAIESISVTQEGTIISGHARKETFDKLGMTPVEVNISDNEYPVIIRNDINDNTKKYFEAQILANTTAKKNIDLDVDLIADIIEEYDIDIEDVGVDAYESEEIPEAQEDDFDPTPPAIPKTVLGDLYEIGQHRLLCGDSTDSDAVASLIGSDYPSLILSDPPYGIGISGQKESFAKNPKHNRKFHEDRNWDNEVPDLNTLLSFNCDIILWGGNYFVDYISSSKGWICWSKGQDGQLTMSDGELAWTNIDKPLRIVTVNRASLGKTVHPTQKPIEVIDFSIKYSNSTGLILDLFLGSGTTMVAAHQLKRKCYGMELDPKYCDVIVKRMLKLDKNLTVKRNGVDVTKEFITNE